MREKAAEFQTEIDGLRRDEHENEDLTNEQILQQVCFGDDLFRKCFSGVCAKEEFHRLFTSWHPDKGTKHNPWHHNVCFDNIKGKYDAQFGSA